MNGNSKYWDGLKNDDFGETLDERFLYILCSDYERYEDMVTGDKLHQEVDVRFYQERLDSLLKTKESQLEKLIQIHANEIIKHRKLFYERVDLNYANRKYSTTNTLSSMILHPEVEKILINGRLMNPSQHGITDQNQGNVNIGTMEDITDAIKCKFKIKDDEPIIGRDELYRQYYAELGQLKERQEKELRDFLTFYKMEQEYFEKCIIKLKKSDEILLPTISFNNANNDSKRAGYKAKLGVQGDKEVSLNNPKKSKITFVTFDSDRNSSSNINKDKITLGGRSFDSSIIESSTSGDVTSVLPVSMSNDRSVAPKTVPMTFNEQQNSTNPSNNTNNTSPFNSTPSNTNNTSPFNSTPSNTNNTSPFNSTPSNTNNTSPFNSTPSNTNNTSPFNSIPSNTNNTSSFNPTPSIPNANTSCLLPSPLQLSTANNNSNNPIENYLNPGAIQILNMLGSSIQQENVNMNEVFKFAGKFFNNNGGQGTI